MGKRLKTIFPMRKLYVPLILARVYLLVNHQAEFTVSFWIVILSFKGIQFTSTGIESWYRQLPKNRVYILVNQQAVFYGVSFSVGHHPTIP